MIYSADFTVNMFKYHMFCCTLIVRFVLENILLRHLYFKIVALYGSINTLRKNEYSTE